MQAAIGILVALVFTVFASLVILMMIEAKDTIDWSEIYDRWERSQKEE